jgi:hypothetical protein
MRSVTRGKLGCGGRQRERVSISNKGGIKMQNSAMYLPSDSHFIVEIKEDTLLEENTEIKA